MYLSFLKKNNFDANQRNERLFINIKYNFFKETLFIIYSSIDGYRKIDWSFHIVIRNKIYIDKIIFLFIKFNWTILISLAYVILTNVFLCTYI